ncbi:MAG TPA: tRNA uracil 4-sulfurtransferase ThiI [Haploplasma sp.]|nr:tRNA uracil 4-sulfurtransferase ThiI [Haploplasma sp.]
MKILIRFGDLMLKGKNRKIFINKLTRHVKNKYKDLDVVVELNYDRLYLNFDESLLNEVEKRVKQIPGIHSYSIVYTSAKTIEDVVSKAVEVLNLELDSTKNYTFKVETKRSDKNFIHMSNDFTKIVAPLILKEANQNLTVDVRNPQITLNINVRQDAVYLYLKSNKGMGGFPATIAGKGLLMMSGGIDSPVAAYLGIKQGVEIELIHFESSPLTPLESINKVTDLAAKLAVFLPNEKIKLHVVPFMPLHEAMLNHVKDSYVITIMRRMMYRIAERFANENNIDILLNGESVGQVASQTLASMKVVENVTNIPIVRPVATYDKIDIINIAQYIDCYDISIRPFSDCCSIYVPKNPVISPTIKRCLEEEARFDFETIITETMENIKTVVISKDDKIDFSMYGFTFLESYENMRNEK